MEDLIKLNNGSKFKINDIIDIIDINNFFNQTTPNARKYNYNN